MEVEERKEENRQMNKLVQILTERLEQPEFLPGGVPVRVAAAVYGKAPYFVHEGIRAGWLPIGHCKPGEQKDSFYISPKNFGKTQDLFTPARRWRRWNNARKSNNSGGGSDERDKDGAAVPATL